MTNIQKLKPEIRAFDGPEKGSHVWVSSQIHGNEPSGTIAIERVINEIESGALVLKKGRVVFVPGLNKIAAPDKRFVVSNVNRRVLPTSGRYVLSPEDILRQQIVLELDLFCQRPPAGKTYAHRSASFFLDEGPLDRGRFVLDLHTFHSQGKPHAWIFTGKPQAGTSSQSTQFALATGVDQINCGWVKAYRRTCNPAELAAAQIDHQRGRTWWNSALKELGFHRYAERLASSNELGNQATTLGQRAFNNGVASVTLEAGQHDDPASIEVAYRAIRGLLGHAGITDRYDGLDVGPRSVDLVTVQQVLFRLPEDRLAQDFAEFQRVELAEPLIEGNRIVRAPTPPQGSTGHVLFPYKDAAIGSELVYYATRSQRVLHYTP